VQVFERNRAQRIITAHNRREPNGEGQDQQWRAVAAFTAAFNITGQPAVSLPLHWSDTGLPIGVQFMGGPWQESLLVRVAS
jgi:amidase